MAFPTSDQVPCSSNCTFSLVGIALPLLQVRGMWTMLLLEPFHLSSFGARVTALCYGFLATILINTCEVQAAHVNPGPCVRAG